MFPCFKKTAPEGAVFLPRYYWQVIETAAVRLPEAMFSVYTVPEADGGIVTVVVPPAVTLDPSGEGVSAALKVPVPPVTRNCSVVVEAQLILAELGVTTIAAGAGAAVPNACVAVGGVSSVRPVASVIANVRPVKHVPFVVIVKPPPLRCTGLPLIVIACGKLVAIV